jgi:hypothetical protein
VSVQDQGLSQRRVKGQATLFAIRQISRAREQIGKDHYQRDTFHCTMVGIHACHAQAM